MASIVDQQSYHQNQHETSESQLHVKILHDRLMEQERHQQDFLMNMYRMQQELSENFKKTEMAHLQDSFHQQQQVLFKSKIKYRSLGHHLSSLMGMFGNLQSQIVQMMKQSSLQQQFSIATAEMQKKKEAELIQRIRQLEGVIESQGQSHHQLDAKLDQLHSQTHQAFKKIQETIDQKISTLESNTRIALNNLQSHFVQAQASTETKFQEFSSKLSISTDNVIQSETLEREKLWTDMTNFMKESLQAESLTSTSHVQQEQQQLLGRIQTLEHQYNQSNKIPELQEKIREVECLLKDNSESHMRIMESSIADVIAAMDILKETVQMIKKDDFKSRKVVAEDFKSLKTEFSLEIIKMKDRLRKEMRYIEKPVIVL